MPTERAEAIKAGAKRYNDGNTCRYGHRAERYTASGGCVECAAEANRRRSKLARTDPDPQELEMTLSQHWQYVGPSRYAVEHNGHTLQIAPNPDREDKRRYISIVDRVPIDAAPSWSLHEAKTKAVKAVERLAATKKADRVFGKRLSAQAEPFPPTDAPAPIAADADPAADLVADLPPCEPAPEPAVEVRAPDPAQAPQLVEHPGPVETLPALSAERPDGLRAVFTVEVQGHDIIAALNALQSAADLLRSLGHVDCQIDLPARIRL